MCDIQILQTLIEKFVDFASVLSIEIAVYPLDFQRFNMEKIIFLVVVLSACAGYASAVNCTSLPNGIYELGCRSYATCTGGQVNIVTCPNDMVYNNQTQKCDDPANVSPPCGELIDCTNLADGRYADKDNNCESWYTCQDGKFLGHNFCSPGTVFDETLTTCNWKDAVAPPCGTLR